jgi:hypothetical protein
MAQDIGVSFYGIIKERTTSYRRRMTHQGDYFRVFCILQMQYVDQVKKIKKNYKRPKILYPEYKQRGKKKVSEKRRRRKRN